MNPPQITRRPQPGQASPGLAQLPPLLQRLYLMRGIRHLDEVQTDLARLLPPSGLAGLDAAVNLLVECLEQDRHILVVGDYDADGATACALAVSALQACGAQRVGFLVPDRFTQGYGLSSALVEVALQREVELLLTVDNGISSIAAVDRAKQLGLKVVVTDHHLPGERLPAADAIVNPNLSGDTFPSKHVAGVGVAFYLMSALRKRLRKVGWFVRRGITEPVLAQWLDLVALGTVADLVRLDSNNRILVEQGMRRIRAGHCRPGISALLQVAGRTQNRLVASDLGYSVGPRLNAAGRLEDMGIGIRCLLSRDPVEAMRYAVELDRLNRQRREIEFGMREQAERMMQKVLLADAGLPFGICLFDPEWHEGVIGILASRVKERYHRPVICLAGSADGTLKGSARSIPGLHIRDVLVAMENRHPGILIRFGGHAMAAGLSLAPEGLEKFSRAFDHEVGRQLGGSAPEAEILSDGELTTDDLTEQTARMLRYAGPWGQGFSEPCFDGEFRIIHCRMVGEIHLKLILDKGTGKALDAIAFQWGERPLPKGRIRVAYRLDLNQYRGNETPQLLIEHLEGVVA